MEYKMIEVRDAMTTLPVLFIRPLPAANAQEKWMWKRAGFAETQDYTIPLEIGAIGSLKFKVPYSSGLYDPRTERTMYHATVYVEEHWAELKNGDLVGVEFMLGESKLKKHTDNPAVEVYGG